MRVLRLLLFVLSFITVGNGVANAFLMNQGDIYRIDFDFQPVAQHSPPFQRIDIELFYGPNLFNTGERYSLSLFDPTGFQHGLLGPFNVIGNATSNYLTFGPFPGMLSFNSYTGHVLMEMHIGSLDVNDAFFRADGSPNLLLSQMTVTNVTPVPAPASLLLFSSGLILLASGLRRFNRSQP